MSILVLLSKSVLSCTELIVHVSHPSGAHLGRAAAVTVPAVPAAPARSIMTWYLSREPTLSGVTLTAFSLAQPNVRSPDDRPLTLTPSAADADNDATDRFAALAVATLQSMLASLGSYTTGCELMDALSISNKSELDSLCRAAVLGLLLLGGKCLLLVLIEQL